MPAIKINPGEVVSAGAKASAAKQNIAAVKNGVRDVSDRLDAKVKGRSSVGTRLNTLANSVAGVETRIASVKATAEAGVGKYQNADTRVEARARDFIANGPKS